MGEYDFTDNLVSLAHYCSSADASLALSRLNSEGIEADLEDDLAGTSLLVRQGDYRRAKQILADLEEEVEDESNESRADHDADDYDADDWSGEDWADDNFEEDDDYSEEPAETPPAIRAWRAAVIGTIILPLNLYSWWLIIKYELWVPNSSNTSPSNTNSRWRFHLTVLFNLLGLLFFWSISRQWF